MTHIPQDHILPQDLVDMHDHGPPPAKAPSHGGPAGPHGHAAHAAHHREWAEFHTAMAAHHAWKHANPKPATHRMHVSDARAAMEADPERWTLAGHKPPHVIAAEGEAAYG